MRASQTSLTRRGVLRWAGGFAAAAVAGAALAACTGDDQPVEAARTSGDDGVSDGDGPGAGALSVVSSIRGDDRVAIDAPVRVEAVGGRLDQVRLVADGGDELPGTMYEDGLSWGSDVRLEPGTAYRLRATASAGDERAEIDQSFRTIELSLDEQTYPSIAPLADEVVGIGMPVMVAFDLPVRERATFERHMRVVSEPAQSGSWHWIDDNQARWRPDAYWRPGTRVRVEVDVNSLPAGDGVYGQESRVVEFEVGRSVIHRVDVAGHRMRSSIDGKVVRSMPISGGKPGFETRSGTKVIMERFRTKTMDAATTGIQPDDPDYYNIDDVEYALRLTTSGEFIHAAPWSAGSQGSANVSHGCVGMSTADARWVYENSRRGDVVEVTGTAREMTLANGFGDWNLSVEEYAEGSALAAG